MKKLIWIILFVPFSAVLGQSSTSALHWDGVDDYVEFGDILNDLTIPFTVEFWAKPETVIGGTSFPIRTSDPVGPRIYAGFIFSIQNGNEIAIHIGDNTGGGLFNRRALRAFVGDVTDDWHHFAAVVGGPTSMFLYLDGVNIGGSFEGGAVQMVHNSAPMRIGSIRDNTYHGGAMKEVRVWNGTRTASQIRENMFREVPSNASRLVGYWKMDEGSGQEIRDSSPNATHGVRGASISNENPDPAWIESTAPIGKSSCVGERTDVVGVWGDRTTAESSGLGLTNIGFLNDPNDWIVFGNNQRKSPGYLTGDSDFPVLARWYRHWCFDFSDEDPGAGGALALSFDYSDVGFLGPMPLQAELRLMRQNEGSGVFEIVKDDTGSPLTPIVSGDAITFTIDPATAQNLRRLATSLDGVFTVGVTNIPLPVELVSFDVRSSDLDIELSWSTASEENNSGFEVQMKDGQDYAAVAWIDGQGNSTSIEKYDYKLRVDEPGDYVFRLKQVDFDGSLEYSNEVEVYAGVPGHVYIGTPYPNPSSEWVEFDVVNEEQRPVHVSVFDISGRLVSEPSLSSSVSNSRSRYAVDVSGFTPGIYFVQVSSAANSKVSKILVQR